ncbi:alpha/beta fold hydrolase [Streptomyces sp. NRRL WC-3744]|uniref:alpha/beta fold hydrolase n=1 Tax=Streptomyces sp. NRRL WC-3744 TaxID=1463935 RepID=UPI0004CC1F6F|nr:hypothetical protein [Streptomyces sp. NRRL WC-3744]
MCDRTEPIAVPTADSPFDDRPGRDALRTLRRTDLTRDARLTRLTVPTPVVWGTADRVSRPSGARLPAGRLPAAPGQLVMGTTR